MSTIFCYLLYKCIFLLCISLLVKPDKRSMLFEENRMLENQRYDKYVIMDKIGKSEIECCLECVNHDDCISLQYRLSTRHCRLFETLFVTPSGTVEQGWKYFINTKGNCPSDFSDSRMPLCVKFGGYLILPEGKILCANYSSELIAIKSRDEQYLASKLADSLFKTRGESHWNELYIQGSWNGQSWKLDNGQSISYSMWAVGYPHLLSNSLFTNIRLGVESVSGAYHWYNIFGSVSRRAIFCTSGYI